MNVLDPADVQDVATKRYVDVANRAFVFDNNKYLAVGEVSMGGKRLENVDTPLENFQATNKFYVDTLVEAATAGDKALKKIQDGIFASDGEIDMRGNSITGLPNPVDRDAAVNKNYVDNGGTIIKYPFFRGVFLLDTLPRKPNKKECGIVNFDKSGGSGTHWVTWYKDGKTKIYFDSYGVQPPLEVIKYLGRPIHYNTDQLQPAGEVFCGHLCLYVLKELSAGKRF